MKTFAEPYNPEGFSLAPGYRWLGRDESANWDIDEILTGSQWIVAKGQAFKSHRRIDWSYRRALCVDNPLAPPPFEWSIPGYEVLEGSTFEGPYWDHSLSIWSPAPANRWITVTSTIMSDWYYRRPIGAQPQPSMSMHKSLIINTHLSLALFDAVTAVAKRAGWHWLGSPGLSDPYIAIHPKGKEAVDMQMADILYWRKHKPDAIHLDAKTEMGKLIDLLDEMKKPPMPTPPKVNGYEGAYTKGGSTIKFGCAEIDVTMMREIDLLWSRQRAGNRSAITLGLSSGVVLSRADVKAILEYVDAVNKAV